jgi:hypothetical protein
MLAASLADAIVDAFGERVRGIVIVRLGTRPAVGDGGPGPSGLFASQTVKPPSTFQLVPVTNAASGPAR